MSPLHRLLDPLKQAATAFFSHDLALRRGDRGVQIVLQERAGAGVGQRAPSRSELVAQKNAAELALILEQLQALLAELPQARQTLRALVFVEQALARKGLRALHKVPLDVLQRALEQLEGLVTNWSPAGLANLRSKMAVAVIDREHMGPETGAYRTSTVLDPVPSEPVLPEVHVHDDDKALADAYAALGDLAPAPGPVELQGELGSASARAVARPRLQPTEETGEIRLHALQD